MSARCKVCNHHLEREGSAFICLNCSHDGLLRAIAGVVAAWDKADAEPFDEMRYSKWIELGSVEPLRELLILYGDPTKPQPHGVIKA